MANAKKYTVDDLLRSVKLRGSVPEAEGVFQDEDLLRFANEEIDENLGPLILSAREEIYLTYEDIQLVAGQQEYPIPYRAYGSKVRIIKPVDSTGKEGLPLTPIAIDVSFDYTDSNYSGLENSRGFYLRNDKIVIIGSISSIGTQNLRVYFYLRPNSLVVKDEGAVVKSIDTTTNTVTLELVPVNFNSGQKFDLIQSLPNHKTYDYDMTGVVNVGLKQITFNETIPTELQVGDFICLAGETITPQVPVDVIPVLEQSVVCKVLESIGDTEGLKNATARLTKLETRLFNLIGNRIEAPGKKIINTGSLLRPRGRSRSYRD